MTTMAACALLAALELDATLIAQTLVSRPLVVGPLLGAATGQAGAGVLYGATFELLGLCDLPVGGCLTWSATVAAGTATLLASTSLPFPVGFAGGLLAGIAHSRAEGFERAVLAKSGDALARVAESGGRTLGRAMGVSILRHAAMTFVVAAAAVVLGNQINYRVWPLAPDFIQSGVAFMSASAPWIGLSGVAVWGMRRA